MRDAASRDQLAAQRSSSPVSDESHARIIAERLTMTRLHEGRLPDADDYRRVLVGVQTRRVAPPPQTGLAVLTPTARAPHGGYRRTARTVSRHTVGRCPLDRWSQAAMMTRVRDADRYEEALAMQLAALLVAEFRRRERRSDEDQAAARRDEAAGIVAARDQGVAPSGRVFADRIP